MQTGQAEIIALEALTWLLGQEDLLPVFLGATGSSANDLRERASDPELLGSVLDFILMDDAWVQGFCGAAGHAPEVPMMARQSLPGGDLPNWT